MGRWTWGLIGFACVLLVGAVVTRGWGFRASAQPSGLEQTVALFARSWLIPSQARNARSVVAATPEVLKSGMEHWADHCASCHGNDGRGQTAIGRSLYPPAPDMQSARTQQMTDGELFYVIERGVPLTGMPAWGTGTAEGERLSWELVMFIRHLSRLTPEDLEAMSALNPKSAAQLENERRDREFLRGTAK